MLLVNTEKTFDTEQKYLLGIAAFIALLSPCLIKKAYTEKKEHALHDQYHEEICDDSYVTPL